MYGMASLVQVSSAFQAKTKTIKIINFYKMGQTTGRVQRGQIKWSALSSIPRRRCFQVRKTYSWYRAGVAWREDWCQTDQKYMILLLNTTLQSRSQKCFKAWRLVLNLRTGKQTARRVSEDFIKRSDCQKGRQRSWSCLGQEKRWNYCLKSQLTPHETGKTSAQTWKLCNTGQPGSLQLNSWHWTNLCPTCFCKDLRHHT